MSKLSRGLLLGAALAIAPTPVGAEQTEDVGALRQAHCAQKADATRRKMTEALNGFELGFGGSPFAPGHAAEEVEGECLFGAEAVLREHCSQASAATSTEVEKCLAEMGVEPSKAVPTEAAKIVLREHCAELAEAAGKEMAEWLNASEVRAGDPVSASGAAAEKVGKECLVKVGIATGTSGAEK